MCPYNYISYFIIVVGKYTTRSYLDILIIFLETIPICEPHILPRYIGANDCAFKSVADSLDISCSVVFSGFNTPAMHWTVTSYNDHVSVAPAVSAPHKVSSKLSLAVRQIKVRVAINVSLTLQSASFKHQTTFPTVNVIRKYNSFYLFICPGKSTAFTCVRQIVSNKMI